VSADVFRETLGRHQAVSTNPDAGRWLALEPLFAEGVYRVRNCAGRFTTSLPEVQNLGTQLLACDFPAAPGDHLILRSAHQL